MGAGGAGKMRFALSVIQNGPQDARKSLVSGGGCAHDQTWKGVNVWRLLYGVKVFCVSCRAVVLL